LCAISHSIADCLYLFVFEIDYSLALITSRRKLSEKENVDDRTHTRSFAYILYAFQSNLNIFNVYMETRKAK